MKIYKYKLLYSGIAVALLLFFLKLSINYTSPYILTQKCKNGKVRFVDVALSPDGKELIATLSFRNPFYVFAGPTMELWKINLLNSQFSRLLKGKLIGLGISNSAWAPDGHKITFYLNRKFRKGVEIYTASADGVFIKQLTRGRNTTAFSIFPQWSSTNGKIAFVKSKRGPILTLSVISNEGGKEQIITDELSSRLAFTWSRNGSEIYYSTSQGLYSLNFENHQRRKLADFVDIEFPSPSPQNKKLLCLVRKMPQNKLWLVSFSNKKMQEIEFPFAKDGKPVLFGIFDWISENEIVIGLSRKAPISSGHLWLINLKTEKWKKLTVGNTLDWHPMFSHSIQKIIFLRGRNAIWSVNTDGTNSHQIFPKPKERN